MITIGLALTQVERETGRIRPGVAAMLGAIGVWGAVLVPVSGFWLFPPLAILAARRRGRPD